MNTVQTPGCKNTGSRRLWSNILLYAVVILLASAANFLEPDYIAQVPIRIGISAYDSAFAAPVLVRYSDLIMEKGGGDITWLYFDEDEDPTGCDFYLMTSIRARQAVDSGKVKLSLAASATDSRSHSIGIVIARAGTEQKDLAGGKFLFTFRNSASGFLSPLAALIDQGVDIDPESENIYFTGCRSCDEKVVYGVLFGRYSAGGISLDRFRKIESLGGFNREELSVLLTGPPVHEIFLVSSADIERWKEKGFIDRLPSITAGAPSSLKNDLMSIGIAGFTPAGENSLDFLDEYSNRTTAGSIHNFP